MAKIRAKAPGAQIDLVSSTVKRGDDRGLITLRLKVKRGLDVDAGEFQEINRISEESWDMCGVGVIASHPRTSSASSSRPALKS